MPDTEHKVLEVPYPVTSRLRLTVCCKRSIQRFYSLIEMLSFDQRTSQDSLATGQIDDYVSKRKI